MYSIVLMVSNLSEFRDNHNNLTVSDLITSHMRPFIQHISPIREKMSHFLSMRTASHPETLHFWFIFIFGKERQASRITAIMLIEHKKTPLHWGALDLALFGLEKDWYGTTLDVPAAFGLAIDHGSLWFVATRRKPADLAPQSRPGKFTPELWKHDVAEFFLSHPASGRYLEFNLAPNGAWWSAEFTAPRVRADKAEVQVPGVKTFSEIAPDGTWVAAASIPLDILKARFDFGPESRMNVTFIVDSPAQKFLSAVPAPDGVPDFHRPDVFQQIKIHDGGLTFHEPQ
jgi:hypothetical protein